MVENLDFVTAEMMADMWEGNLAEKTAEMRVYMKAE